MADQPQRPAFHDGQVLAAASLDGCVVYARNQTARHERYLHTFGIVEGLDLTSTDVPVPYNAQTVQVKQITLTAGMAIDGYGREIVVPADLRIGEERFEDAVGTSVEIDSSAGDGHWSHQYPVFLIADERDAPQLAFSPAPCRGANASDGVLEDFDVLVGRRGAHVTLGDQRGPAVAEELSADSTRWRILLGFVRLHVDLRRFVEVSTEPLDDVGRRYAGVRADEVVARSSRLDLRAGGVASAPGKPMVRMVDTDGGSFQFGLSTKTGGIQPAFTVKANGDVALVGVLDPGVVVVGTTRIESGLATNGLRLPLPQGVSEEDVTKGKVALHVAVTPHFPFDPKNPTQAFAVVRCDVDADRVAHCSLVALSNQGTILPGACDYAVVATAKAS
jgi:hypothetical protein